MTDLRLDEGDGTYVVVDGRVLKVTASDLILDAPGRHTGHHGLRRALVHDQRDGLTINYNRDYPGGVTINDVVLLDSRQGMSLSNVATIDGAHRLPVGEGQSGDALLGPVADRTLVLHGELMFEPHPHHRAEHPAVEDLTHGKTRAHPTRTESLQQTLQAMQDQIDRLTERVAELESRPHG
jgi:hypothetical protein